MTVETTSPEHRTLFQKPNLKRFIPGRKHQSVIALVLFMITVLAIWQGYSLVMPPILIPSPERVVWRFFTMWSTPGFLTYAGMTVVHVLASVFLSFVVGSVIAFLAHFFPVLQLAVYKRAAPFMNSFPGIGWAFLGLIWFGINSRSVIFSASLAMMPLVIINVGAGLRELDRDSMEMAQSFTRSPWRRIWRVMLPMQFPYMFAALRLCFGLSWQIVLVVELLCGAAGLGSVINLARQRYSTDMIFATVLLILIAVFLTDRLIFSRLQERIGKKYGV